MVVPDDRAFGPEDNFLAVADSVPPIRAEHATLMTWRGDRGDESLCLLPYPRSGHADVPRVEGLPVKPRPGSEIRTEEEEFAHKTLARMNQVVSRIQELEEALDDPENVWARLQEAWDTASSEENPRMAEIVRQAGVLLPTLQELERRLRRVLRRERDKLALDRVQEIDRASMIWLARQPGRNVAERAGPSQRVLAIARRENFDTLENRVLHSYTRLASAVAREWLREHDRARTSKRYMRVETYYRHCQKFGRELEELGVGFAEPGVTPNYVLLDDKSYRAMRQAWIRLLRRTAIEDELWAWQAESWTDFCTLALTLGLYGLEDAVLVAQSPILWHSEMIMGRWFSQENPLAVFWLQKTGLVVEVQSRPRGVSTRQAATLATLWLRVTALATDDIRRIAVWTPHMMHRPDLLSEARDAAAHLSQVQRIHGDYVLREGLLMVPAHGEPATEVVHSGSCEVQAIALDAAGTGLGSGARATAMFVEQVLRNVTA
jgi:hypothetical protein